MGLNFAPAPRSVPVRQLVAAADDGIQTSKASQVEMEAARNSIVGILKKAQPPTRNISPECKALKALRQDHCSGASRQGSLNSSDGRESYDQKIRDLLSDGQVYKNLRKDPSPYLAFRRQFYQQSFGTAMGSPVSVTVADLVMEDVEQRALSSYPDPPPFWRMTLALHFLLSRSRPSHPHQHSRTIHPVHPLETQTLSCTRDTACKVVCSFLQPLTEGSCQDVPLGHIQ